MGPQELDPMLPVSEFRIIYMAAHMDKMGAKFERSFARKDETVFALSHVVQEGLFATLQTDDGDGILDERICGMQRSRAWCGTPPILGVVNMVGTRNFTCYMGAL